MSDRARVLVIAAHPDDEVLGCGGTIARHAEMDDVIDIVFLSDGIYSRGGDECQKRAELVERRNAAQAAARILGAREPCFFEFPDQRLDRQSLLDIVQSIESVARELKPTVIYTHHDGDLNSDHRIVAQAALTAFRPLQGESVRAIYGFEVLSSTEWRFNSNEAFHPNRFVNVSKCWNRKIEALKAYNFEMRSSPHPRSYEIVEVLGRLRGSSVGLDFAEAFAVYREVVI